jgi:hypothetical protein
MVDKENVAYCNIVIKSAIKNEFLSLGTISINLEYIMLSKTNLAQMDTTARFLIQPKLLNL